MTTEKDYRDAVLASTSLSDMCRFLNILPMGGNFDTMKHAIARYNLDTSHFSNKVILQDNHGKKFSRNKDNKQTLIDTYGYVCSNSECNLSEWNGKELVLQVDHIDGQNTNDAIENLRLLCPNCHSETETFCIASNVNSTLSSFCVCGKSKGRSSIICSDCLKEKHTESHIVTVPKKYKKESLEAVVKDCYSYSDVMRKLKKKGGGSQAILINAILYYNIDVSHFTGQAWSKGKSVKENPKTKAAWKNKLILERGHKCERCERTHWVSGKLIPLELEHVDGNNKNNIEENLKLLCSNCHSQTKTWKRKKTALSKNKNYCLGCDKEVEGKAKRCRSCHRSYCTKNNSSNNGKEKASSSKGYVPKNDICKCGIVKLIKSPQCEKCYKKTLERIEWPSIDELLTMVVGSSYSAVGRFLGVSDNAVRKRIKNHS